jgi:hypothetical protein
MLAASAGMSFGLRVVEAGPGQWNRPSQCPSRSVGFRSQPCEVAESPQTVTANKLNASEKRRRVSMKIKSMLLVVAASLAFTSQSFAGDLLDRMLGMGGCGCAPSCCEAPAAGPGCGSDAATASACCDPCARPRLVDFRFRINWSAIPRPNLFNRLGSAGCDSGCDTGCAAPAGPSCGNNGPVAADPSCGNNGPVAADPSCGSNGAAAPAAGPSCGADAADCGCAATADPCCGPSLNLLGRLGNLRARIASRPRLIGACCDSGCDAAPASCCGAAAAPACGTN